MKIKKLKKRLKQRRLSIFYYARSGEINMKFLSDLCGREVKNEQILHCDLGKHTAQSV